jgi:iron complex transport system substrate-binding protein
MGRFCKRKCAGMGNLLLAGWLAAMAGGSIAQGLPQAVAVTDDRGQRVTLPAPAQRVIALSPSLTELVFAAGGGNRLAGVAEHSNHPEAARSLPRIGDALSFQLERLLALDPDLILAWQQGNNPRQLERLAALGIPIYYSQINRLDDVATTLERIGVLLASPGKAAAEAFRRRLEALRPASAAPVRVLYQVWSQPLMTVNGRHVISDLIARCGGVNVFAAESALVPQVGVEAAIAAAPEAIIAAGTAGAAGAGPLEPWRRYPVIPAVAHGFLFLVDGDAISRPGPRLLDAGVEICRQLDRVRRDR